MWLVEQAVKEQIHWETAQAILNSALTWGTEGEIAAMAGIRREYLSKLRRGKVRPPLPETAEKVAKSLVKSHLLSLEQELDLLEHMHLARGSEGMIQQLASQDRDWLGYGAIGELGRVHYLATYSKTPQEARTFYGALLNLGETLVREFHRAKFPLEAARAHSLLQDVLCVFNRPGAALYHAKMARATLDGIEPDSLTAECGLVFYDPLSAQEHVLDYYDLQVNAIRIEAVCHNLLGFYKAANDLCDEALQTEAVKWKPVFWQVHILRDKLNALGKDPKGALEDIEQCARQGCFLCEAHDDSLGLLLLRTSLARGYLLRGLDKKAKELLYQELTRISRSEEIGQLHKAMLLSRLAAFHRKHGSEEEWRYFVGQALSITRRAGLVETANELAREHGDHPTFQNIQEQITDE